METQIGITTRRIVNMFRRSIVKTLPVLLLGFTSRIHTDLEHVA